MKKITTWIHHLYFTGILLICVTQTGFSQAGANDPTFNPGDLALGTGANNLAYCSVVQNDGKIIISGTFTNYNSVTVPNLIRLNTDGSRDNTFNTGTGANNVIYAITIQADGKIVIGGDFTSFNGTSRNRIARLNIDGSLDNTFNPGTGANNIIYAMAVQTDGKMLIGGDFTSFNGTSRNRIARLNTNGSLDNSFNPGTGVNGTINAVAVQANGEILIGGGFTTVNGTARNRIARLLTNGSLEFTFNPGTGPNNLIYSIAIQADGRIVIGGEFTSVSGTSRNRIARLNTNGSLDNSFNPGTGANSWVGLVAILPDGKIMICGNFTSYNGTVRNRIIRLNTDGSPDNSFNSSAGANAVIYTLSIQTDGKIVIGGVFTSYNGISRNYITRLNTDGSLDNSFNPNTGINDVVNALSVQADGKIVIGGLFTGVNGISRNRIDRLNADGTSDNNFNTGTGADNAVYALGIQADGKILIGGEFTTYNGATINRIARLNADGTLDNTFNPGTGPNNMVLAIVMQADGKILIGGNFTTYNGTTINRIARLNTDGTLDNTFNPGTGANGRINSLALQPDGKIVIGGEFPNYNGATVNRIARLSADGTLDNTFITGTGFSNTVNAIAIQPDGKILTGGTFVGYNNAPINRIVRLNADGTRDNTFNPGTGLNNMASVIVMQPDGKILIGGNFTTYNGTTINRIARLNADGTLDNTFTTGSGASNIVNAMAVQGDGRMLIGGNFASYNSIPRNRLARILNCSGQTLAISNKTLNLYIVGATSFVDNCLDLITTVTPNGATPVYGSTTAKVWIESMQPQQYVKRHFEITPAANASTSTSSIKLYFTQSEFDAFNAVNTLKLPAGPADAAGIANLRIEKRSGSSSDGSGLPDSYNGSIITIDPADANIIWDAATSRWEVSFDVTGHSGFFAKTSSFVLPVTWIDFHAAVSNSLHAALEWKTDAYNVSGYVVEKSENGRNFNAVARLNALGNGVHTYGWTDPVALKETNYYYRIRQTDVDGSFSFSNVIAISLNIGSHMLQVYPNPLKGDVRIISGKPQKAVIADITGKAIKYILLMKGSNDINLAGLQNGMYFLRTQDGKSVKLIKE